MCVDILFCWGQDSPSSATPHDNDNDAVFQVKNGQIMSPELELMLICQWGKNTKRLERILSERQPNVNYKNDDGVT